MVLDARSSDEGTVAELSLVQDGNQRDQLPVGAADQLEPVEGFDQSRLRLAAHREQYPVTRVVVAISDLDDSAAQEQEVGVLSRGPRDKAVLFSRSNVVLPYNEVSAAHALAVRLSDDLIYPPGTIFVITVDPHVGKNADDGNNVADKRVVVRYEDGTFLVGPARSYLRVGEFQGRGRIVEAVEIDRDKLVGLGLTATNGHDVFDGLRRFAPAAAALLHDVDLAHIGTHFDASEIPALEIPEGTVTDIEPNYENIRVEVPVDKFSYGEQIAIRDKGGRLLCVARRTQAFDGNKGEIVAANGSKKCIAHPGKALYLAAVQGHLQSDLSELSDFELNVGDCLSLSLATEEDIRLWTARRTLHNLGGQVCDLAHGVRRKILSAGERVLAGIAGITSRR